MEFNKTKFKDDHRDLFVIDKIGGAKMFERRDLNLNNVETDIDKWDLFNEDPDHIWKDGKEDNRNKKVGCASLTLREVKETNITSNDTMDSRWHRISCHERNWAICELGLHDEKGAPIEH